MNNQIESIKSDRFLDFYGELNKVKDSQRLSVIVTHGFVELLLNVLIVAKFKHGKKKITSNNRDYTQSVKLVILNELNLIDDELFRILDWFRRVRNRAAHEPFFELTPNDLDFAGKSMSRFVPTNSDYKLKDLYHFCAALVGTIWNKHLDVLRPVFAPSLDKKDK